MHERPGLVVGGHGEGDAELDRRQRQTALEHRVGGVEGADGLAPFGVTRPRLELDHQRLGDIVLDGLVVGRDVALALAVEVELAHLQGIAPDGEGDLLQHPLAADHPLWATEAAKGGIGDGVGLKRQRAELDRGQPVAMSA